MKRLGPNRIRELISGLIPRISPFCPDMVVSIATGGIGPGRAIGKALDIPVHTLEIRYPLSPHLSSMPQVLKGLLWPAKELAYKFTKPTSSSCAEIPSWFNRVVLVDDSASSGKTLRAALELLKGRGYHRERIMCAVIRCGNRAKGIADVWATDQRVIIPTWED